MSLILDTSIIVIVKLETPLETLKEHFSWYVSVFHLRNQICVDQVWEPDQQWLPWHDVVSLQNTEEQSPLGPRLPLRPVEQLANLSLRQLSLLYRWDKHKQRKGRAHQIAFAWKIPVQYDCMTQPRKEGWWKLRLCSYGGQTMTRRQPTGLFVGPLGKSFTFIIREGYDLRPLQVPRYHVRISFAL